MTKAPVPFEEQETSINIDYIDKVTYVYSTNYNMVRKLYKLKEENPDDVTVVFDNCFGMEVTVPTKWIKITPPRKMSEEQKQAAAERLKSAKEKKANEQRRN